MSRHGDGFDDAQFVTSKQAVDEGSRTKNDRQPGFRAVVIEMEEPRRKNQVLPQQGSRAGHENASVWVSYSFRLFGRLPSPALPGPLPGLLCGLHAGGSIGEDTCRRGAE